MPNSLVTFKVNFLDMYILKISYLNILVLAERLTNFNIGTMNTQPTASLLPSQYSLCANFVGYPPAGTTTTVTCQPGTAAGRYLVIQLPSPGYLSLCEVQVYPAGSPPV